MHMLWFNFILGFNFVLGMLMYDNEFEMKENII